MEDRVRKLKVQGTRQRKSCTCWQIKRRNSFSMFHQQTGVQPLPGKQSLWHVTVYWEDKYHNTKHPSSAFFYPVLFSWAWCHMELNIFSTFLCAPILLTGRKVLTLHKHCSAVAKTLEHSFHPKPKRQHRTSYYKKQKQPKKPDTIT